MNSLNFFLRENDHAYVDLDDLEQIAIPTHGIPKVCVGRFTFPKIWS